MTGPAQTARKSAPVAPFAVTPLFLKLFIPLGALLMLLISLWYIGESDMRMVELKATQAGIVGMEKGIFETEVLGHISDAVFLADAAGYIMRHTPGHPLSPPNTRDMLENFARHHRMYIQVRILDAEGREAVRVDNIGKRTVVRPQAGLQDKSDRDYCLRGLEMAVGQVYVSCLDLNQESGKVEEPFTPTLRLASPIEGPDGSVAGLMVLNFNGGQLLRRMRQAVVGDQSRLLMTTGHGDWIIGPSPQMEWGHSLPQRAALSMPHTYPQAWRSIESSDSGQFVSEKGALITFATLSTNAGHVNIGQGAAPNERRWKVIAYLGPRELAVPWTNRAAVLSLAGLLVLAMACWFRAAAVVRRRQAADEIREHEQMISAISEVSQDAIAMVDSDDRVLFWNSSAERMFGYAQKEAVGARLHQLVAPEDQRGQMVEGLRRFGQSGEGPSVGVTRELVAKRKDGSAFPLEVAISALRKGGQWYAVGSMRDISRRKAQEERLRELATTDGLTGLANRRHFRQSAKAEISRARRYNHQISLIMFDVDHFKFVNDNHGHDVGDEVLRQLADTAVAQLREVDLIGRLGGEEFAVLLPETGPQQALEAAERLRAAVEAAPARTTDGEIGFTISLGVSSALGDQADLERLLKMADDAMYEAKNSGRNRVCSA